MKSVTLDLPDEVAERLDRAADIAVVPPSMIATAILTHAFDERERRARLAERAARADPGKVREILDKVPDVPAEEGDEWPAKKQ